MGAAVLHADGQMDRQTDMTKLIVALHNFADAPKKVKVYKCTEAKEVRSGQSYVCTET